jgi:outer membrane biosynthesis protein TonB
MSHPSPPATSCSSPTNLDVLDIHALRAVLQWRFSPARRDGRPVDEIVHVELTFTLRK